MCADATQACRVHRLLELLRAHGVEAGGLDFLVTGGSDGLQGSVEVFGQQFAQRVKLQTERQIQRIGVERKRITKGDRGDGGSAGELEEVTAGSCGHEWRAPQNTVTEFQERWDEFTTETRRARSSFLSLFLSSPCSPCLRGERLSLLICEFAAL